MLYARISVLSSKTSRQLLISIALVVLTFLTSSLRAQPGETPVRSQNVDDKIALHQALLDLTNAWTVMCVAAHPDDEDGATLTVLRRKYGVHTVTLFSTFGEGGQNAIGPELYEELGAIRAQETMKASEIQGSEPHFLGLKDFGFSKSAEEAFRVWGHDEALRRMVLEIRKLRPDVIITNHDTTSGHGHHQATGRLALEAFDAAADPKAFPEQLKVAGVWQVQRLFVRIGSPGGGDPPANVEEDSRAGKIITIDRNEVDPVRGISYAQQSLLALQQHASQGPWPASLPKEGWTAIRYRLVREANNATPVPLNAATLLDGMTPSKSVQRQLSSLTIEGRPLVEFEGNRERLLDGLMSAGLPRVVDEKTSAMDFLKLSRLRRRLDAASALACGLSLAISMQKSGLLPLSNAEMIVTVSNDGTRDAQLRAGLIGRGSKSVDEAVRIELPKRLAAKASTSQKVGIPVAAPVRINIPHSAHLYDGLWRGEEIEARVTVTVNGNELELLARSFYDVAPSIEISSKTASLFVVTPANLDQPLAFTVLLKNNQDRPFKGEFGIQSPTDNIKEVGPEISLAPNETKEFTLRTKIIPIDTRAGQRIPRNDLNRIKIRVHPLDDPKTISEREVTVVYCNARVAPDLRVGYVRSFDDSLRNALDALGVESQELSVDDLRTGDPQRFDAIIIDNRGYLAHPELIAANSRLMQFTKNGGTLIVNYHRPNEFNADSAKDRPSLAPYSITVGNSRVTDENAQVSFTEPLHPLLNTPNKIEATDFEDWIQERGLYYPKSWDPRYQALFSMHDSGEEPLRGGLLVADYGRGHYIYTSMVWYRQLRAGVPGGYRMFANMISYGKVGK